MKRIIHALAVLWPLPPRTGPSRCESANPQIRVFANSPISASAIKNNLISCFLTHISVKFGNKSSFSDIYTLTKGNLRQARNLLYALRSRNSYVKAFTILFMCLIAALNAPAQSGAAANSDSIQPLQIGDKIPEELWHLPLQVVNHPEGKDTITLNEYRGRAILLDFLSTGCSGCVAAIPKLETIGLEFSDDVFILPITPQKRHHVETFISKNEHVNKTELSFVVEDQILKTYFPHLYISHVVWVDPIGVIRATTGTNHVTARTLRELQKGIELNWPVKAENTRFFNSSLITLNVDANELPNNVKRSFYFSTITGYTEGLGPYVASKGDSLMGIERITYRNGPILDLYLSALDLLYVIDPHDVVWEVECPGKYSPMMADLSDMTEEEWNQLYAICYERTVPLGTSMSRKKEYTLLDLNNLLGLHGRLETRNGETYFILSSQIN